MISPLRAWLRKLGNLDALLTLAVDPRHPRTWDLATEGVIGMDTVGKSAVSKSAVGKSAAVKSAGPGVQEVRARGPETRSAPVPPPSCRPPGASGRRQILDPGPDGISAAGRLRRRAGVRPVALTACGRAGPAGRGSLSRPAGRPG